MYVSAVPVAVKVTCSPLQIVISAGAVTVGSGLTVTVTTSVASQPVAVMVPVTV